MGLSIKTNIASQEVLRNLKIQDRKLESEYVKLASGKRINQASDDAAGLAMATKMEAQIKGMRQAVRNSNDGVSLVQTAEGGLSEVSNMLVRLRELSIQAASDILDDSDRSHLNTEYQQLMGEVDRIASATEFNGIRLLSGDTGKGTIDFQVGTGAGENQRIQFEGDNLDSSTSGIGVNGSGVESKEDARDSIEVIDEAIHKVGGYRAQLGSVQKRLHSSINNLEISTVNLEMGKSNIIDTDFAEATSQLASSSIAKRAGTAVLAQANFTNNDILRLVG